MAKTKAEVLDLAKDFKGRLIEAGQEIVYPVRQGAYMWLTSAKVVGFKQSMIPGTDRTRIDVIVDAAGTGGAKRVVRTIVSRPDRCVIVG